MSEPRVVWKSSDGLRKVVFRDGMYQHHVLRGIFQVHEDFSEILSQYENLKAVAEAAVNFKARDRECGLLKNSTPIARGLAADNAKEQLFKTLEDLFLLEVARNNGVIL